MKKIFSFVLIFSLFLFLPYNFVNAKNDNSNIRNFYDEQLEISGADNLFDSLPQETKEMLVEMGISSLDYESVQEMNIGKLFGQIGSMIGVQSRTPLSSIVVCIGIMLLCAFIEGFNVTVGERSLKGVTGVVGSLSVCTAMVIPLCKTIEKSVELMNGASGFMLLYVPIMTGLTAASGKEAAAGSYYTAMMTAGEIITQLSSKVIAPLMNVFLALSVTSALSPKMNLNSLCGEIYKTAKWILTFSMSIFVTMLSVQTMVSSSLDNVSKRALRFAVSSFVPVVGGVLSETISTFSGSLELLKSGAGVFVIIAAGCLFLPIIIECFLWQISIFLLTSASEIMGLEGMSNVFRTIEKVISMLVAVLICILTIFIISTVIILLVAK